ncbi:hypothetical protein ACFYZ4_35220 [Streptomyces sp. NPDC001513]|uniref:hypothetical protein n=1 Tax=Streptomyces sp. NPDC001513 TaxID=3364580 RepID=UPI0036A0ECD1
MLDDPGLPDAWREALNASLDALAARQTRRLATPGTVTITQEQVTQTLAEAFPCLAETGIERWAPAHADLTWANVMGPEFSIIDWEDWGMAPRGRGAATLWGNALAVRTLADRVCQECLTVRVEGTKVQNQEGSADPGAQGPDPAGLSENSLPANPSGGLSFPGLPDRGHRTARLPQPPPSGPFQLLGIAAVSSASSDTEYLLHDGSTEAQDRPSAAAFWLGHWPLRHPALPHLTFRADALRGTQTDSKAAR